MQAIRYIFKDLISQISNFFSYFFVFYVVSLVIALFSETWRSFFYWKAFHISILIMAILAIINKKNRVQVKTIKKDVFFWNKSIGFLDLESKKIAYFKFLVILLILIYSIFNNIPSVEFIILVFGLISIFFAIDSKISAGVAILILFYCVILTIYKKDSLAETYSTYAYYLLIILVITQIKGQIKKVPEKKFPIKIISGHNKYQSRQIKIPVRSVE